ncbi:MAG TPA: hypothetical protein VFH95_12955 [Candidatus Kapabacteria bacterium]|nr:hypothetical protein [Candidatus Kapabacteria bacterium]
MKSLLAFALLATISSPSFAQHEENISFGVGLSYSPFAVPGDDHGHFGTPGMTNFFVPMQFGPYIRFEPELGLFFKNYQEQVPDSSGASSTFLRTSDQQIVRAGFGIFYTKQPDKDFQYGLGARIGIISSEYEMHQARTGVLDSNIHYGVFYLGGAFSVEYFVSKHFSFGGELQFLHYGFGAPLVTVGSNELSGYLSPDSPQQSVWSTSEVLSARFWF